MFVNLLRLCFIWILRHFFARKIIICALPLFFGGCYSIEQSVGQLKLFSQEQSIDKIIAEKSQSPERLQKLKLVSPIMDYGAKEVLLTCGNNYKSFIDLPGEHLSYIVQAAEKRELKLKTWWFPFIGSQPYLGFFRKESALKEAKDLKEKGYDLSVGSVDAFSLLGFFKDPVYSSMTDNDTTPEFIETLFHECLHRTVYVSNQYSFNENLANFVGRQAAGQFLKKHTEIGENVEEFVQDFKTKDADQKIFQKFLVETKNDLNAFYKNLNAQEEFKSNEKFELKRSEKFEEIFQKYEIVKKQLSQNSVYKNYFKKDKINNAIILAYSVYESKQNILQDFFIKCNDDLKTMIFSLLDCLPRSEQSEGYLWEKVQSCPVKLILSKS